MAIYRLRVGYLHKSPQKLFNYIEKLFHVKLYLSLWTLQNYIFHPNWLQISLTTPNEPSESA